MAKRAKTTDHYFKELVLWRDELSRLREILSTTNLEETLKWGIPCYVQHGENIVGLAGYKSYFGLWFYQGALLSDPKKLLINAQEGKTRALRQWRMTSMKEIKSTTIKSYVKEATTLAAAGEKISPDSKKPLTIPAELSAALNANRAANAAFKALRSGQQREYAEYVNEAKRDATKLRRIEKILPMIKSGDGLHDKYR